MRIDATPKWLAASCLLANVTLLPSATLAQQPTQYNEARTVGMRTEAPLVLLFAERPAKAGPAKRDDPAIALRIALRDILRDSGKFRTLPFDPTEPAIEKALKDRRIAATDAVEPVPIEAMQRLGRALGASYLLAFRAAPEKQGIRFQIRLIETAGKEDWRTVFLDDQGIPYTLGKRKLRLPEMITMVSDYIGVRMGLSSQLPEDLRFRSNSNAMLPNMGKPPREKPRTDRTETANAAPAPNDGQRAPMNPAPNRTAPKNAERTVKNPPKSNPPEPVKVATPEKINVEPPQGSNPTNNAPQAQRQPVAGNEAPPPTDANKPDNEAMAMRYRQVGDLANVIISLRRAINERTRDMGLRRQLIQAYQDRQMPEAAATEAERALYLAPDDPVIHRLFGDAQFAKGNLVEAEKAYREAIRLDPKNIPAQVALGDMQMTDGRYEEAARTYEEAAKSDPKSPLPHRKLAKALASRAAGDPKLYAASLERLSQARALILPSDTETYQEDYAALMRLMEARLRDMLDELQNQGRALQNGKSVNETIRGVADLKERGDSAADYMDKLPPAVGQDRTHAHYLQAASLLLQAIGLFKENLSKPDKTTEEACKGAQVDALRELATANRLLTARKIEKTADK